MLHLLSYSNSKKIAISIINTLIFDKKCQPMELVLRMFILELSNFVKESTHLKLKFISLFRMQVYFRSPREQIRYV